MTGSGKLADVMRKPGTNTRTTANPAPLS